MLGGMTPAVSPAASGAIPNSPAVPPASINAPSQPGGGNIFEAIMGAIVDPDSAAVKMAEAGMTPEQFSESLKGNALSDVMKQGNDRPSGQVVGPLGNVISPTPNPAPLPNSGTKDLSLSGVFSDLMKPAGAGADLIGVKPNSQIISPNGMPIAPPVPPTPIEGVPIVPNVGAPTGSMLPQIPGEINPTTTPNAVTSTPMYTPEGDPLEAYYRAIRSAESGGNDSAKNPNSSATGRYQWTKGTWAGLMDSHPELKLTSDGRINPDQNERAIRAFTQDNADILKAAGIPINNGNLYAAHFLGAGGAKTVLKGAPDALVSSLVGEGVVDANPFLKGMTVDKFNEWTSRKASGSYKQGVGGAEAGASGGVGTADAGTPVKDEGKVQTALDAAAGLVTPDSSGSSKKQIPPPDAIGPRPGSFQPDANTMKLMLAMLAPMFGQIPTLTQLQQGQQVGQ